MKLATGAMGVEVVLVAVALSAVEAALAVGFVTALVVAALVVAAGWKGRQPAVRGQPAVRARGRSAGRPCS